MRLRAALLVLLLGSLMVACSEDRPDEPKVVGTTESRTPVSRRAPDINEVTREAARAMAGPEAVWLGSHAKATDCPTAEREVIRPDVAAAISLGPIHATVPPLLALTDHREPFMKVLWFVDEAAGESVRVIGRHVESGTAAVFVYEGLNVEADTAQPLPELRLVSPFRLASDAARGFMIFPLPGCYKFSATWDGGTASASIWVFYEQ